MSARRRWGWAIAILIALGAVTGVSTYLVITSTEWGRKKFITWALNSVNGALGGRGRLTVGVLNELSSDGISASDVALLDTAGAVVLHVNELHGKLAYSELLSKSIHITQADLRGVQLNLKRDFSGPWNVAYIINGGPKNPGPHLPAFGDDIRIDAVTLSDGKIAMQYPWSPNDAFKGKARDSVIAVRKTLHEIAVVPEGLFERRHIELPLVVAHEVLVLMPGKPLSSLMLDSLAGTISDPSLRLVHAGGRLQWTPDSLLLDLPTVALPASTASAKGKINWSQPGAVRYDVLMNAEASLSDLGWIWNVLPAEGRGSATVRLRTLASADDAEYTLTKLDVAAMQSHVSGKITVVSRPLDMLLQGVDLSFAPIRSELLRRLSYDAVPASIKGTFRGHLIAKHGGPLTAFPVDHIDAIFDDDRVAGAQSSIVANGEVGFGAAPTARNVQIANARFDLRTLRAIQPSAPPVDGILTGSLLIASANLKQAKVPQLDLRWTDAANNSTHITGMVDAQYGGRVPIIAANVLFDSLALKSIVRIDSTFPLSSTLHGKVLATGPLDSLTWVANLLNANDLLHSEGLAALRDSVWTVTANNQFNAIDLRRWSGRSNLPVTAFTGEGNIRFSARMLRDSTIHIADAEYFADITQKASTDQPAFTLRVTGGMDERRLHVDSSSVILGGIALDVRGALARDTTMSDTLIATVQVDSLSAARPELIRLANTLQSVDSALAKTLRSYATDTLRGDLSGSATMVGAIKKFAANVSLSARDAQVGILKVRRVFGSVGAVGLPDHAHFDATATVDDITGIGKVRLSSAAFKIEDASPSGGRLRLDVVARDTTALRVRGAFTRNSESIVVTMDSMRFNYGTARWTNARPVVYTSDSRGIRVDSLLARSNQGGLLALNADVPETGPINAGLRLEKFPAGEVASFALGSTTRYRGFLSGTTQLTGSRLAPLLSANFRADSVGTDAAIAPPLAIDASYASQKLVAHAVLVDSVKSRLRAEARVPIDLSLHAVDKRLLSDNIDAELVADSLPLAGLRIAVKGVSQIRGIVDGRLAFSGTVDRPVATGRMTLENFGASVNTLGINPTEGRVVVVAEQDQLKIEQLRFRSGTRASDTLRITGVVHFPADKPMTVEANMVANNAVLANQPDGTDLTLSGTVSAKGPLKRPDVVASLFIPRANLIADPLGARSALDLTSAQARELLGSTEVPVAQGTMGPMAKLGQYMNVTRASLQMGDEVWVRTPESAVKLGGTLDIKKGSDGLLAFDGEVTANRGIFRLDLKAVKRTFTIDSGKVRFYGNESIVPTVGVYATHVVRATGGVETPIHVAITGTFDKLVLALSTEDEVFSGAPESEVISLLIFGAPTFALPSQSQSTVKAVTGVLIPTLGGKLEQKLQNLFPVFNTFQLNTAGGQENLQSATSFLDNLSIAAGKQLGDKTFLRFNTGLCRGNANSDVKITGGLSAEYRFSRNVSGQIGVDQGASPCTQIGSSGSLPKYQFGFDLFREWVF